MLQTTTPQQVVRLFSTYRLPGALENVTVGGGVNWQSEFFGNVFQPNPSDTVNFGHDSRITQHSYYLVDVMARYRFNEHLSTTLNVKNLFDKTYYTGLGNFGTGFYGEPRSLQLTTSGTSKLTPLAACVMIIPRSSKGWSHRYVAGHLPDTLAPLLA